MDKKNKISFFVTAILVSCGMGLYVKKMTGTISLSLLSFIIVLLSSICCFYVFLYFDKKKRVTLKNCSYFKICVINVVTFLLGTAYLIMFEMIGVMFAKQNPSGTRFHVVMLLIIIVLFIATTILDIRKARQYASK